jgi:hypothetical protein
MAKQLFQRNLNIITSYFSLALVVPELIMPACCLAGGSYLTGQMSLTNLC